MSSNATNLAENQGFPEMLASLVRADGSAEHGFVASHDLKNGKFATRNLADVVHHLCTLHGRHPGVIDLAAAHTAHNAARQWLLKAVDGFVVERGFLSRLVVTAGPLPSTPGQAESESAVNGQRHALDMLARSDREGCALGAALSLVIDWPVMRDVLNHAAKRWGVDAPECTLPTVEETLTVARGVATSPAIERAISFGSQQILAQHRGLWDLLEARALARGEY
ncbi:MAG: hypothetical protein RLZZ366_1660 [Pseudomonadota bacterium]|jgi:hypothetical protein